MYEEKVRFTCWVHTTTTYTRPLPCLRNWGCSGGFYCLPEDSEGGPRCLPYPTFIIGSDRGTRSDGPSSLRLPGTDGDSERTVNHSHSGSHVWSMYPLPLSVVKGHSLSGELPFRPSSYPQDVTILTKFDQKLIIISDYSHLGPERSGTQQWCDFPNSLSCRD